MLIEGGKKIKTQESLIPLKTDTPPKLGKRPSKGTFSLESAASWEGSNDRVGKRFTAPLA